MSVDCVRALVAAGADVNAQDASGKTLLMKLADCSSNEFDQGHADSFLRPLLALGANPNLVDANGYTALIYCCATGCKLMACALIDAGADVNVATRRESTTALIEASRQGYDAVDIICALIAAGASIGHAATNGDTAYSVAAEQVSEESHRETRWAIVTIFDKIENRLLHYCDSSSDSSSNADREDNNKNKKLTGAKLRAMIVASLSDNYDRRRFLQSPAV